MQETHTVPLRIESFESLPFSKRLQTILECSAALEASQDFNPPYPTGIKTPLNRLASFPLGAARVGFAPCVYIADLLQPYRRKERAQRLRLWVFGRSLLLLLFEREIERLHLRFLLLRLGALLLEGLDLGSGLVELEGERADVLFELIGELLELRGGERAKSGVLRLIRSLEVRRGREKKRRRSSRRLYSSSMRVFSECWVEGREGEASPRTRSRREVGSRAQGGRVAT